VNQYAELYRKLGGYPYDRDPTRPDWYAITPGQSYAPVPRAKQRQRAKSAVRSSRKPGKRS